jgi:hypothetical protein
MAMTNTEQNTIFQNMKTAGVNQVLLLKSNETSSLTYVLCACTPIKQLTASEAAALAVVYSTTIASP